MIPPAKTALKTARDESDRVLSAEEVKAYLDAPVSDRERQDVRDLVRWFRGRYPTGAERLAYIRIAYARWKRQLPGAEVE